MQVQVTLWGVKLPMDKDFKEFIISIISIFIFAIILAFIFDFLNPCGFTFLDVFKCQ